MREIFLGGGEQEFMVLLADIAQHEADLLAAFDLDLGGGVVHLVHKDLDGARGLLGIAGLAGRKDSWPCCSWAKAGPVDSAASARASLIVFILFSS